MASLRRVKTPELSGDSIEDSMSEIDRLYDELRHDDTPDRSSDAEATPDDVTIQSEQTTGADVDAEPVMRKSMSLDLAPLSPELDMSKSQSMDFSAATARQSNSADKPKTPVANIGE